MHKRERLFTPALNDRAALDALRERYPHLSTTQIIRWALHCFLATPEPAAPLPVVRRGRKPLPDSKKKQAARRERTRRPLETPKETWHV